MAADVTACRAYPHVSPCSFPAELMSSVFPCFYSALRSLNRAAHKRIARCSMRILRLLLRQESPVVSLILGPPAPRSRGGGGVTKQCVLRGAFYSQSATSRQPLRRFPTLPAIKSIPLPFVPFTDSALPRLSSPHRRLVSHCCSIDRSTLHRSSFSSKRARNHSFCPRRHCSSFQASQLAIMASDREVLPST